MELQLVHQELPSPVSSTVFLKSVWAMMRLGMIVLSDSLKDNLREVITSPGME